jgi:HEAT repeat protein
VFKTRTFAAHAACLLAALGSLTGAHATAANAEKEQQLIKVLQSDAPPQEKAITCKRLAIHGSEAAVPALAPLLADEKLASWARIPLEAIPGSAADEALRAALGKLQGKLLIGVINSIGVRRDAKAVDALAGLLKQDDAAVASAAAEALGRIGGEQAAAVLEKSLASAPAAVRSSVAIGCVLCAERFLEEGNSDEAERLYTAVLKTDAPQQRHLEATRGVILARGAGGVPMLIEKLRSKDKEWFGLGLRVARELPGPEATDALTGELARMSEQRQAFLLRALGDRGDPKALPAILQAAKSGPKAVRRVALGAIEQLGNASCIPTLLDVATEDDAEIAQKATVALARLSGEKVEADILDRLGTAKGKKLQALVEVAMHRRMKTALPAFVRCATDTDAGVRAAAVTALGVLGDGEHVPDLARILQATQDPKEQEKVGKALRSVSARAGASCVQHLMPLTKSEDASVRAIAVRALASAGGPDALSAVIAALEDKDSAVRDEAVRTLSRWPSNWPHDVTVLKPLLALAKNGKRDLHKILALRGYLQCVQGATKMKDAERLAKVTDVLPLVTRREEKRLAISVLGTIPANGAFEKLTAFAAEPAVVEEAATAIVKLAGRKKLPGVDKEPRRKALQAVIAKSKSARTKKQAVNLLKRLK